MFNRKRHHHIRSGEQPAATSRSTPTSPSMSRCSTLTESDTLTDVIFRSRNTRPVVAYPDSVKLAELLAIADCSTLERRSSSSNSNSNSNSHSHSHSHKSLPDAIPAAAAAAEQPVLERNSGSFSFSNSSSSSNGEGSSAFGLFRRKKDVRGSSFSYATRPTSTMPKPSRLHPGVLPLGACGGGSGKERHPKGRSVSPLLTVADMRLLLSVDGHLMQQNCHSEPPSPPSDANDASLPPELRHPKSFDIYINYLLRLSNW